jgi:hypothetical protein
MRSMMSFALAAAAGIALAATPLVSQAQLTVSIGAEPACPYGYYDYAPYSCSPSGYYGPQYFNSGVFVGVGPWFHGANDFHGTVNNRYDPQHGYKGKMPSIGDKAQTPAKAQAFKGNEERDGRGNVTGGKGGKK